MPPKKRVWTAAQKAAHAANMRMTRLRRQRLNAPVPTAPPTNPAAALASADSSSATGMILRFLLPMGA